MRSLILMLVAALCAGCVTVQERPDGTQRVLLPWQQPQQPAAAPNGFVPTTPQAAQANDTELQDAVQLAEMIERTVPKARVNVATVPGFTASRGVVQLVDGMTIDMPAAARGTPAYKQASEAINAYARTFARSRRAATLEMAMNAADARSAKFEASAPQEIDVDGVGKLTLIRRTHPTVPFGMLRILITPRKG